MPGSGGLAGQGVTAHYWASTVYDAMAAFRLYFTITNVQPDTHATGVGKINGFSVRCVLDPRA